MSAHRHHDRRRLGGALLGITLITAACAGSATGTPAATTETGTSTPATSSATTTDTASPGAATTRADTHYDATDLDWDAASAVDITLADGASTVSGGGATVDGDTVTITTAGTYRVHGTLTDGAIVVAAGDGDQVKLVLDGASITSSTAAATTSSEADELVIILADGSTNSLSDAATHVDPGETSEVPVAALASQTDLTIGGTGSLTVNGLVNDGISAKDGLVIASGTIAVTSVDDAVRGKDYLVVLDGAVTVQAGGDGLKSDEADDATLGYVAIAGGTLDITATSDAIEAVSAVRVTGGTTTISAGDDGIHSEAALAVSGGTIDITGSVEGLEGTAITISGGEINVVASDDGVNVAGDLPGEDDTTATDDANGTGQEPGGFGGGGTEEAIEGWFLDVSGGTLVVTASGDALDSNGATTISAGTVVVNGSTRGGGDGAFDTNGTLEISGGVVVGAGGITMGPGRGGSASTTQATISFDLDTQQPAGTVVQVRTTDGAVVLTYAPPVAYQRFVISTPDLVAGTTYEVFLGGTLQGESVGGLSLDAPASGGASAGTVTAS